MSLDAGELYILARDLHTADGRVGRKLSAVVRKGGMDVDRDAKILAAKDTGNMSESISTEIIGNGSMAEMGFESGPTANYAPFVEYPTAPHVIEPKTPGGVLAFKIGDRTVFARRVMHPGTQAQPFMRPSFDRNLPGIIEAAADAGEDSVFG